MVDKLTWDSPEVRELRERSDREGIATLVREGRLELSRHNPYRRLIAVDSSPDPAGGTTPGGKGEPLTSAEFAQLQREGRVSELREAAAAGRIPWSKDNPYRPTPATDEGA